MRNLRETLDRWNIPLVPDSPACPEATSWLLDWARNDSQKNLLLTEAAELDSNSAPDTAAWVIAQSIMCERIKTFAYQVNGIGLWSEKSTRPDSDVVGKLLSCDLFWIEEITAGELTEHQRTLLHAFLIQIKQSQTCTIISISTTVEQLCDWVGDVIAKFLTRNFTVIEV